MISFELTEEQRMLTETVQRFATRNMRAVYREAEDTGTLPEEVVEKGWDLGLVPSSIPDQYGGFGAPSAVTGVLYAEELGWGDLAISLHLLAPALAAIPILHCGTDGQKETYLPQFCDASFYPATAALVEPTIQFDPSHLATTATRDGDSYVLNGTKAFVPLAAGAELILVYANEDGKTQAFLVDGHSAGLQVGDREKTMGFNALMTYRVVCVTCACPLRSAWAVSVGAISAACSIIPTWPCQPWLSEWPALRTNMHATMPNSAWPSVSRLRPARPLPSCWPTWPPTSMPCV
jgi:alkylation response protein AidB-like acyl-CoA dehydrogenase